jgi:hypothetical protein
MSDAKKTVEAVKKNDLKGKYGFVLDAGFEGGGQVEDESFTSRCTYEFERFLIFNCHGTISTEGWDRLQAQSTDDVHLVLTISHSFRSFTTPF